MFCWLKYRKEKFPCGSERDSIHLECPRINSESQNNFGLISFYFTEEKQNKEILIISDNINTFLFKKLTVSMSQINIFWLSNEYNKNFL